MVLLPSIALCIHLVLFLPVYLRDRFLEVGLLGQRINTYVIFLEITKFPPYRACTILFSYHTMYEKASFPTVLPTEYVVILLRFVNLINEIWHLGLVLIGISLIMNKVKYLFICLGSDSLLGP